MCPLVVDETLLVYVHQFALVYFLFLCPAYAATMNSEHSSFRCDSIIELN
jgi:hypothetical protein